jgi:flagellar biogenesis protein FliO
MEQVFAILAVLGLLGLALVVLRTRGHAAFQWPHRRRDGASLEVLERVVLTPQHSLHLVRVGDKHIVVAASPQGCSRIGQLNAPPPSFPPAVGGRS